MKHDSLFVLISVQMRYVLPVKSMTYRAIVSINAFSALDAAYNMPSGSERLKNMQQETRQLGELLITAGLITSTQFQEVVSNLRSAGGKRALVTEALQTAIFTSTNFSSIATDEKGVIQIFNVGAECMLGYQAAEVVDKITPADISDPQEVISRAAALSQEFDTPIAPGFEALVFKASREIEDIYELTYIRKDGSRFPALVSVTALRDDQDDIIGYLLIGTDNTARKLVEAEQKLLDQRLRDQQFYTRSLFESNIDPIMTTDPSGIITDVNKQMEALTGCTRDELIGAPFKNYFTDQERAEASIKLVLNEKKVTNYELTARARDGKETVVSYNATTFYDRDRKLRGVFAAARDVTESKRVEEEMITLNRELTRRTVELEAVNHELESFSYSVSHDLKAPLRSVDGFARFLEEDYGERLDDEGRRLLTVIRDSAREMGQLVTDLLAFSRLSRKELTLTRLDMGMLVRDVWTQLATPNLGRTVKLHVDPLPSVFGDAATIHEVFVNLLSNAIKFTRPREQALIEVSGYMEASEVVYVVKDNGAGFNMDYGDKLFGVFQRLHSSEEFEGTGIGLALVQRIIQRHGGRVWAKGIVNEGATFYFALPKHAIKEK